MLNHSFQPNCFLHWRSKDRMLEVMINAGQRIKKGDEVNAHMLCVHCNVQSGWLTASTIRNAC